MREARAATAQARIHKKRGRLLLRRSKLRRLMQAATNTDLISDGMIKADALETGASQVLEALAKIREDKAVPPKYEECLLLLQRIMARKGLEGKAIVWTYYVKNIKQFSQFLRSNDIDNEVLYGETPIDSKDEDSDIKTRDKIIDDFHKKDCPYKVIVANPQAVGESISLHKACLNAIYMDRDFNATTFIQSKDRIHRYGLRKSDKVRYYFLMSKGTVDETIDVRLKEKEQRMADLVDKEEIPLLALYESEYDEQIDDVEKMLKDYDKRAARSG